MAVCFLNLKLMRLRYVARKRTLTVVLLYLVETLRWLYAESGGHGYPSSLRLIFRILWYILKQDLLPGDNKLTRSTANHHYPHTYLAGPITPSPTFSLSFNFLHFTAYPNPKSRLLSHYRNFASFRLYSVKTSLWAPTFSRAVEMFIQEHG